MAALPLACAIPGLWGLVMLCSGENGLLNRALSAMICWLAMMSNVVLLNICASTTLSQADEGPLQERSKMWVDADAWSSLSVANDCGVYALSAMAYSLGRSFDPQNFMDAKPIAETGLNSHQILEAVRELGLDGMAVENVSTAALASCCSPAILHVTNRQATGHWVAFLGMEGGEFVVFDPGRQTKLIRMSHGELQSVWTGHAILCATENAQQTVWWIRLTSLITVLPLLAISICGALMVKYWRGKNSLAIFLVTFLLVLSWHMSIDRSSLWANLPSAKWLVSTHTLRELPRANVRDLKLAMADANSLIVDAQPSAAYSRCHFRTATNLPIDVDLSEFRETTKGWNREDQIIVMCGSISCGWADHVANRLVDFGGFRNVRVFAPGVQGLMDIGWDTELVGNYERLRQAAKTE